MNYENAFNGLFSPLPGLDGNDIDETRADDLTVHKGSGSLNASTPSDSVSPSRVILEIN